MLTSYISPIWQLINTGSKAVISMYQNMYLEGAYYKYHFRYNQVSLSNYILQ